MAANILVVDDDETVRSLLQMVFQREGWKVSVAENGEVALAALNAAPFDLMVTDLHMPKMNGFELIPRALDTAPQMPILVLSADSTLDAIDKVFRHAIKGFLPKPFDDVAVVVEKARTALEVSRTHRSLHDKLARARTMLTRAADDAEDMS